MPDFPTPTHMDPAAWATYAAAHEQVDAAIRAAEISAQIAWDAAVLQVAVGAPVAIAAACAALYAGRLTYKSAIETAKAAIKAAEHQVKLEIDKHEARVNAYAIRQRHLIDSLIFYADAHAGYCDFILDHLNQPGDIASEFFFLISNKNNFMPNLIPDTIPDNWNDEKWEDHALLGNDFVKILINVKNVYGIFESSKEGLNILVNRYEKDSSFDRNFAREIVIQHKDYVIRYKKYLETLRESFHEMMTQNGLITL